MTYSRTLERLNFEVLTDSGQNVHFKVLTYSGKALTISEFQIADRLYTVR